MQEEKDGFYQPRRTAVKRRVPYGKPRFNQVYKRSKVYVSRGLRAPVPYKLTTAMLYNERVTLSPTLGLASVNVFTANGTYDPNITGGGHQPRGFDQMMALYDHNVVIGCDIRVDIPGVGQGGSLNPTLAFIGVRDSNTVGTSSREYLELSNCVWRITSAAQGYPTTLRMSINPNKYLGRSFPLSDPNLKNTIVGNPIEQVFWHVGLDYASGLDPTSVPVTVTIKYTVVFIEPKDPGQS